MYLKIGIEEYGIVRPFDLIDYFQITNISLKDILKFSKEIITQSEYILLKKFVEKNTNGIIDKPNEINQIMSSKIILNYQKDKKGNPIPGTEEIFPNEEKTKIINYLKNQQIPLNLKTYNLAYNRYKNGTLTLNQSNKTK